MGGGEPATTNNRMELTAAIRGLSVLTRRCKVIVYTDSEYVRRGIDEWLLGWKNRGWKTAAKKPVKNKDLWLELDQPQHLCNTSAGDAQLPVQISGRGVDARVYETLPILGKVDWIPVARRRMEAQALKERLVLPEEGEVCGGVIQSA